LCTSFSSLASFPLNNNANPIAQLSYDQLQDFVLTRVKDYSIATIDNETLEASKGNANAFIFGGGLDFITKKNTELGYMYQRLGSDGFHSVKLGVKLFDKNK
jgi:hypothetical protein